MRCFPLGISNEAAGTAPVASLVAPNNLRIRQIQIAAVNVSEVDGGCLIQVGTNPTFVPPSSLATTQSPQNLYAHAALDNRLTTSGASNSTANVLVPVDVRLQTGQSLNVFVGAITGTVDVYGIINVYSDGD